jgi:AraC family transcriptional regulator
VTEICPSGTSDLDLLHRGAVERVIAMMRQELSRPLPLSDLASAGLFSRFHFHRLFRSVTAMTPARFLAALRMSEARRMLLHTSLTVAQIGSSVGYASTGTFATQFTRLVGASPLRFRELVQRHTDRSINQLYGAADVEVTLPAPYALMVVDLRPAGASAADVRCTAASSCALRLDPGRPEGVYEARVLMVDGRATPAQALVDEVPGGCLTGTAQLRVGPSGRLDGPAAIALRPPLLTDPPLLSAMPIQWLDRLPAGAAGRAGTPRRAPAVPVAATGSGRVAASITEAGRVVALAA